MTTVEFEQYQLGYANGLRGIRYTRAEAELKIVLRNTREVDLYMLGQDEGFHSSLYYRPLQRAERHTA